MALLADATYCCNDLGRLLFQPRIDWQMQLHVPNFKQSTSSSGHTTYQLLITATPRNSLDFDVRRFTQESRFRDLNRLWQQLSKLHQQLYLRGIFPDFAKAKVFGKYEPETIAERISLTARFLNFVLDNDVMRKAKVLHEFFAQAREMTKEELEAAFSNHHGPLDASALAAAALIDFCTTDSDNVTASETPSRLSTACASTSESPPSTSQQPALGNKSPQRSKETALNSGDGQICEDILQRENGAQDGTLFDFPDCQLPTTRTSPPTRKQSIEPCKITNGSHEAYEARRTKTVVTPPQNDQMSSSGLMGTEVRKTSKAFNRNNSSPKNSNVAEELVEQGEHNYLFLAAKYIAAAQKAEEDNAYLHAFHNYKCAVDALMQVMQMEHDLSTHNAIRKKTAKYLLKAEKLYRTFIAFDGPLADAKMWNNLSTQESSFLAFRSANRGLKTLRFLDVLPNWTSRNYVMLVEDQDSGQRFVMKLLEKNENASENAHHILPEGVPHMVQLIKFFETETFIILLLEFVPSGRLWDFLSDYFDNCERFLCMSNSSTPNATNWRSPCHSRTSLSASTSTRNIYQGNHVHPIELNETTLPFISTRIHDREEENALEGDERLQEEENIDSVVFNVGVDALAEMDTTPSSNARSKFDTAERAARTRCEQSNVEQIDCNIASVPDEEVPAEINLTPGEIINWQKRENFLQERPTIGQPSHVEELNFCRNRLFGGRRWPGSRKLSEPLIVHWMAQLVSAIYVLHSENLILRDLRPDNLLIDENGDLMLTYMSAWSNVDHRDDADTIDCRYTAPELNSVIATVTDAVDRWSLGALLLELLCGQPLFQLCWHTIVPSQMAELSFLNMGEMSYAARDLIARLLVSKPESRLSDEEVRAHVFFNGIDWRLYDSTSRRMRNKQVDSAATSSSSALEFPESSRRYSFVAQSLAQSINPDQLLADSE